MTKFLINPVETTRSFNIPDQEDLDKITFEDNHLRTLVNLLKKNKLLTDRTISKIPNIAKNVFYVYKCDSQEDALGMTAKLLAPAISSEYMSAIIPQEVRDMNDKFNLLLNTTVGARIIAALDEIERLKKQISSTKPASKREAYEESIHQRILNCGKQEVVDKYTAKTISLQTLDFIPGLTK